MARRTCMSTRSRKSMFFSNATRPTYSSTGQDCAMPCSARKRAPSPGELEERDARRDDLDPRLHAVALKGVAHRGRGDHDPVECIALTAGDPPSEGAHRLPRHERDVVGEIFLEERVVRRHHRYAPASCEPDPRIVREKRRLHMHEVEALALERPVEGAQSAPAHRTVLGIEWHRTRRDPEDARVVAMGLGVSGRDQSGFVAEPVELGTEGPDGGGDAVDAWEVDVRDVQDAHSRSGPIAAHCHARYVLHVTVSLHAGRRCTDHRADSGRFTALSSSALTLRCRWVGP